MPKESTTFALVHGGAHRSVCWHYLIPELAALGHDAVTMDLPVDDLGAGCSEYADAVIAAIKHVSGPIALVGHSLAGLTVPVVAERFPIDHLIFLCALLPVPGMSVRDQFAEEPEMYANPNAYEAVIDDEVRIFDPSSAAEIWYGDCSKEIQDWAIAQIRPQGSRPYQEITPLNAWPTTRCDWIFASEDRAVNPAWQRRAPIERYGVRPYELVGSSHSPFLSRPRELAALLHEIVVVEPS